MRFLAPLLLSLAAGPSHATWAVASSAARSDVPETRSVTRAERSDTVRRLDILIVLYTRSFAHQLTHEQVERVHEEVLEFVRFYRSSLGDAVALRISLLQIDRELPRAEVSEVAPGRYYLAREDIETELTALGMREPGFNEVIALYAWNNANPDGAVLAYGGGAVGPDGGFLGDAGYNSIGVFAWDPGRISQIMIHEVLHNLDDMFSMSGMPDAFLNADEMSRNMPTLLDERPGAFLPHYADDEMLNYAERERANRATYPWSMQLVYYGWMLGRTPRDAWLRLNYGQVMEASASSSGTRPLYDRIYLGKGNDRVYLTAYADASGPPPTARLDTRPLEMPLGRRTYRHTDFDGSSIFEGPYWGAWLALDDTADSVTVTLGEDSSVGIVGLEIGELQAPARVVSYTLAAEPSAATALDGAPKPGTEAIMLEARTARLEGEGALRGDVRLRAEIDGRMAALTRIEPGRFVYDPSGLAPGDHVLRLEALSDVPYFAPRTVEIQRRRPWRIHAEPRLLVDNGSPVGVTVRVAHEVGVQGARATASVAGSEIALRELADGRYAGEFSRGLAPGLDTIRVRAVLGTGDDTGVAETFIPVYARPRGWIQVPSAVDTKAGEVVVLEARVRDRMGELVVGTRLPIAVIEGDRLVMMEEDGSGVYRARLAVPAGEHRLYVVSLEGSYERRVVWIRSR